MGLGEMSNFMGKKEIRVSKIEIVMSTSVICG